MTTTLLVDSIRARRQKRQRSEDVRRQYYTDYLVALTETDAALQLVALGQSTPVDPATAVAAFRSNSILAHRYQVSLVASPAVAEAAETAYARLRDVREALVTTSLEVGTHSSSFEGSPKWTAVHHPYTDAIGKLRQSMQQEIAGSMQRIGRRSGRKHLKQPKTSPLDTDVEHPSTNPSATDGQPRSY